MSLHLIRIASYIAIIVGSMVMGLRLGRLVHRCYISYHLVGALLFTFFLVSPVVTVLRINGLITPAVEAVWLARVREGVTPMVVLYALAQFYALSIWFRVGRKS